ncbi:sulfatase-like hydrolase/transferase [Maribellus sediminis]|uniref:sulfatase-like hydrolase/transferase n=1 Tax=Maribellus sediminis TaxID=2696285 RepID=UPI00197F9A19|nr:sulfatase-like hydrolase/transferase [Maribellus sediminis]
MMYYLNLRNVLVLAVLIVISACSRKADQPDQPNIILIYADDLGIGLLGSEGQQIIKTPHIDNLAGNGIRFENAYSCMLCAPARASLLTGRHDCHADGHEITDAGIYKKISTGEYTLDQVEAMINETLSPIPDNIDFMADIARKAGYRTAEYGKLEWGFAASDKQMKAHGWDQYFGYLDHVRAHGFYPPFLFGNGKLIEIEGNTRIDCGKSGEPETPEVFEDRRNMEGKAHYSQELFMDSVLNFISANQDRPFFLYFPTQLPHGPVAIPAVHPDFENDDRLTQIEKEYASMVKMLDDNVGQIIDELKRLQLLDNTVVIFTSDNGHEIYYAQKGRVHKPYTNMQTGERFNDLESKYYSDLAGDVFDGNGGRAGMKRSNLQGGISVPLIIQWPGKIKPGRTSDLLTANYDLLPTIADLTGYKGDLATDGLSFYKELLEQENAEHDYLVYSSFIGPTLITNDGWKIRTYLSKDVFELYYLPDDFREENNLAAEYPEKLEELKKELIAACDGDLNNGLFSSGKSQIRIKTGH